MAQWVRQADRKQCQEQPLGGPRLPVLALLQAWEQVVWLVSSGWDLPVRGELSFFILCLPCGFAAWTALSPKFQVSPPSQPCTPPPPPGCLPHPSRADTPKTLLALSTLSTQNLSSGSPRRVTFCLYIDTSGAYLLSPNQTQVRSSRLTSTNLTSPHLEGGGGDFLLNEETQAWRRQGICSRSQWESLKPHLVRCFNALSLRTSREPSEEGAVGPLAAVGKPRLRGTAACPRPLGHHTPLHKANGPPANPFNLQERPQVRDAIQKEPRNQDSNPGPQLPVDAGGPKLPGGLIASLGPGGWAAGEAGR